jgi:hypothetical protein
MFCAGEAALAETRSDLHGQTLPADADFQFFVALAMPLLEGLLAASGSAENAAELASSAEPAKRKRRLSNGETIDLKVWAPLAG